MKTFKLIIAFLLAITCFSACSVNHNDNYCFSSGNTAVTSVTGADSTTVNEPVVLTLTFLLFNTCGEFSHFAESNGYPKEIFVVNDYEGCYCEPTTETGTKEYTFTATQAGEYELKFLSGNNAFITKTITVTE